MPPIYASSASPPSSTAGSRSIRSGSMGRRKAASRGVFLRHSLARSISKPARRCKVPIATFACCGSIRCPPSTRTSWTATRCRAGTASTLCRRSPPPWRTPSSPQPGSAYGRYRSRPTSSAADERDLFLKQERRHIAEVAAPDVPGVPAGNHGVHVLHAVLGKDIGEELVRRHEARLVLAAGEPDETKRVVRDGFVEDRAVLRVDGAARHLPAGDADRSAERANRVEEIEPAESNR